MVLSIHFNSYLAARLGGIKQKMSSSGSAMNNTFLLFYSPKPRSQVWILIDQNWRITESELTTHVLFLLTARTCGLIVLTVTLSKVSIEVAVIGWNPSKAADAVSQKHYQTDMRVATQKISWESLTTSGSASVNKVVTTWLVYTRVDAISFTALRSWSVAKWMLVCYSWQIK